MRPLKVALIGNDDFSMWHFRRGLIREWLRRGCQVNICVPRGQYFDMLASTGANCIEMPMERFMSPLHDILLLWRLWRLFRRQKFELVHTMTIKPNIYGTIAAWLAGTPRRYCLISGLGFMFANGSSSKQLQHRVARLLYRFALSRCTRCAFQNPDDLKLFVREKLIPQDRATVILGSGVDTSLYSSGALEVSKIAGLRAHLALPPGAKCVSLIAARMIWSKGIREFVTASLVLGERFPDWYFLLVAPRDDNSPDRVPIGFIETQSSPNLRVIDTFQDDIRGYLALSDVFVLPSFYPEGVPRSILEAMSFGCPVVTTDTPGCRETVVDGRNGFLIAPQDADVLVSRLDQLIRSPATRRAFGAASRELALSKFSEQSVVNQAFANLYHEDSNIGVGGE